MAATATQEVAPGAAVWHVGEGSDTRPEVGIAGRLTALGASTLLQIVLLSGVFILTFFHTTDPDFWWHLTTGRYIAETGSIPSTDPFSYTAAGQPWIAHEWLSELLIYTVFRTGGYLPLVLLFATVITITHAAVLRTARVLGQGPVAATCITAWVAAMSVFAWNVRPQWFSYLFFSVYLLILARSRTRADRWIWVLPALMVPWVNLHAGYMSGLLLLGSYLVGRWMDASRQWSTIAGGLDGRHLAVAGATIAATLLNPHGVEILLYPFSYVGSSNASMKYITEWQSPDFHHLYFFVFGGSLMALMVIPTRRRVDWAITLPLLLFTAMSLQSVRMIPFYAIAAAPVLAMRLPIRQGGIATPRQANGTPRNWLMLAVCLAAMGSTLFLSDRTQWGPEPRTKNYPVEGVRYIKEAGLHGRLINTFHWGGYLIWSFYPERRVFADGRPDMYGDAFMDDFAKLLDVRPGWEEVLERYGVEVALLEKDSRTATLLMATGRWRALFTGEIETVLVRSGTDGSSIGTSVP